MIETKNVGQRILKQQEEGVLRIKEFEIEKVHVELDELGNIVNEHPFTQTVYLVSIYNQYLWMSSDDIIDLKTLLNNFFLY